MLDKPRLKAHYRMQVVDTGTPIPKLFLLAEGRHFLLSGKAATLLPPLLDGRRTVGQIVAELADSVSPMETFSALRLFEAGGHLADGRPDLDDAQLAWWDLQGMSPRSPGSPTESRQLLLHTIGIAPEIAQQVTEGLRAAGIQVAHTDENTDPATDPRFLVVLADDYLAPELAAINTSRLATKSPWLLARPTGRQLWIGPLLEPGTTGCHACLAQRVAGNRQVERYLTGRGTAGTTTGRTISNAPHPTIAYHAATGALFTGLLATELTRYLSTGTPARVHGTLLTVDTVGLGVDDHVLVAQPQCRACGDPRLITERSPKIVLRPSPATHTTDGGHRTQSPKQTFERMQRHISPILGAVTTLSPHADSDNGITYSFTAGHNFAMVNDNIDLLRRNLRGQSGGKGRTEIQAKVSAVCEAVERYCAVWRGDEPVLTAAYQELPPGDAVHPEALQLFSAAQQRGRREWNARPENRLHLVPERFDTGRRIDWARAWSLTADAERLIPAAMAWYGHPDLSGHFFAVADSNGSAAGNTLEEALLQGMCELTERDAVAIWWYNRIPRREFDLDSLNDPYIPTIRAFYDGMDRDLWVLDITSDLGIPTFAAVSRRRHEIQDVMVGFGAHPDARTALFRSLTEVNQFLPYVDQRDADGNTIYRTDDLATLDWCRTTRVQDEPWLRPSTETAATLTDFEPLPGDDLADHVRHCVAKAARAGVEVIALDQSRPDLDLAVVKMFAPGMRHFWRRLGPGRLYDVPVRQGWLDRPYAEADLNPRSVFF